MNSNRNHRAARAAAVAATVSLMVMLAGCATSAPKPARDPAAGMIAGAAKQIHQAMRQFQSDEAPNHKPAPSEAPHDAALTQPITFNWDGPVKPAVQAVAGLIGWRFETHGARGPLPLNVSVHAHQTQAFMVLKELGVQAGSRADVTVNLHTKTVELDYAGESSGPQGGSK